MKLRATLRMHHPGYRLGEILDWLHHQRESGFSDDAMVKMGKTTGQKYVMIISEDKEDVGGITPVPQRPETPVWGDD